MDGEMKYFSIPPPPTLNIWIINCTPKKSRSVNKMMADKVTDNTGMQVTIFLRNFCIF